MRKLNNVSLARMVLALVVTVLVAGSGMALAAGVGRSGRALVAVGRVSGVCPEHPNLNQHQAASRRRNRHLCGLQRHDQR